MNNIDTLHISWTTVITRCRHHFMANSDRRICTHHFNDHQICTMWVVLWSLMLIEYTHHYLSQRRPSFKTCMHQTDPMEGSAFAWCRHSFLNSNDQRICPCSLLPTMMCRCGLLQSTSMHGWLYHIWPAFLVASSTSPHPYVAQTLHHKHAGQLLGVATLHHEQNAPTLSFLSFLCSSSQSPTS